MNISEFSRVAATAITAAMLLVPFSPAPVLAHDDTFMTLDTGRGRSIMTGDLGYTPFEDKATMPYGVLDARTLTTIQANSKNSNPTAASDCLVGSLPINTYPILIRNAEGLVWMGGQIRGEVPQASDWTYTYCNSPAINFINSVGPVIDGLRARRGWDGARFSQETTHWTLKNSWFSDIKDDCIENDQGKMGYVRDVLFDGCYMGLSMAPGTSGGGNNIVMDGVLMRMKPYFVEAATTVGSPFKFDVETTSGLKISNSIIAYGENSSAITLRSVSRTERAWVRTEDCTTQNNLVLWLPDGALPGDFPTPPADCFAVQTGATARATWAAAKTNWINCHPKLARFPEDPTPNPASCDPTAHGGKG
jgi:hypothetical protein